MRSDSDSSPIKLKEGKSMGFRIHSTIKEKSRKLLFHDMVFVFSVGGGHLEKNISANIVRSLELAQKADAKVCGVVGRDGGYTAQVADACVVIPSVNDETVTPHTEGFQAVIWHLLVSHPDLQKYEMKWESVK